MVMNKAERERLRELCEKATPGPRDRYEDHDLLIASRASIQELIDALDALEEQLSQAEKKRDFWRAGWEREKDASLRMASIAQHSQKEIERLRSELAATEAENARARDAALEEAARCASATTVGPDAYRVQEGWPRKSSEMHNTAQAAAHLVARSIAANIRALKKGGE